MFSASDPPLRGRLSLVDECQDGGGPPPGRGPMVWLASALVLLVLASGACSPQPVAILKPTQQVTPADSEPAPRSTQSATSAAQASPSPSAARLGFEVRGWT